MKRMDLFKIGMYVGMGATVGKWFGDCINAALDGTFQGIIIGLASNGNKRAQKACDVGGFSYKKFDGDHKKNSSQKMNVHIQPLQSNLHDINEKKEENENELC